VVKDTGNQSAKKLESSIQRAAAETELIKHENEGLRASLATKNKRKRHGKVLPLTQESNPSGGGSFWSPKKMGKSIEERVEKDKEKHQEKL
jgi:hypothetical protein